MGKYFQAVLYISLPQGSVQRITIAKFDRKIQLATSVREHTHDRTHRTRRLGDQVVALSLVWTASLVCTAQDWPLLPKGQLYKQTPHPSINSKLYSKKSYAFDRRFLSSNNFKKKRSYASIKEMGQPQPVSSFVKADEELSQQFRTFFDWEFLDSICVNEPAMSKQDKRALSIMKESICLKEGHYQINLP